jgi:hypothetical protein
MQMALGLPADWRTGARETVAQPLAQLAGIVPLQVTVQGTKPLHFSIAGWHFLMWDLPCFRISPLGRFPKEPPCSPAQSALEQLWLGPLVPVGRSRVQSAVMHRRSGRVVIIVVARAGFVVAYLAYAGAAAESHRRERAKAALRLTTLCVADLSAPIKAIVVLLGPFEWTSTAAVSAGTARRNPRQCKACTPFCSSLKLVAS